MSGERYIVLGSTLTNLAEAIREKTGSETDYTPLEMATAIRNLPTGGSILGTKNITLNGNYTASADGLDGYSSVSVDVPNSYTSGDEGKVVSNGALVTQTAHSEVTQNGTVDTTLNNSVLINVSGGGSGGFDDYHIASQYDSGEPAFCSAIASPNRGGSAPSGTFGLVYFGPVDLTTKSTVSIVVSYRDNETNTSNGMIFGVSSTLPESWSDAKSASKKQVISSSGTITIDVSDLSGNYYLFYATELTYVSYGWCKLAFKFEV